MIIIIVIKEGEMKLLLSCLKNTLSSQDFAGMDKFRLRERSRNIKEMCVKINKTKKGI